MMQLTSRLYLHTVMFVFSFIFSKTHLVEVPRMLRDSPDKLEEFVKSHPQK